MIDHPCLCCQVLFTPNKYHPEQEYCRKAECKRASHNSANRKYRAARKRKDPLHESHRKRRSRRSQRLRIEQQFNQHRQQLCWLLTFALGALRFVSGIDHEEQLRETIRDMLDTGRELLRGTEQLFPWEDRPGFG